MWRYSQFTGANLSQRYSQSTGVNLFQHELEYKCWVLTCVYIRFF